MESGILPPKEGECLPGTDLPCTFIQSREVQSARTSDEIGKLTKLKNIYLADVNLLNQYSVFLFIFYYNIIMIMSVYSS